jgi:hypothetical protein
LKRGAKHADDPCLGITVLAARRGFRDDLAVDQLVKSIRLRDCPEIIGGRNAAC